MIEENEVTMPVIVEYDGIKFIVWEEKIIYSDKGLFSVCFVNKNNFVYRPYKWETDYRRYNKKVYKFIVGKHINEMPGKHWLNYFLGEDWIPKIAWQDSLSKEQRDYFRETYREVPQRRAEDWLTSSQESELKKMKSKDLEKIEEALS